MFFYLYNKGILYTLKVVLLHLYEEVCNRIHEENTIYIK